MVSDKIADKLVFSCELENYAESLKHLFSVEKLSYYTDFMKKTHVSY